MSQDMVNSEKSSLFYFSVLFFILMFADFISTNYALSKNIGYEGNPIMVAIVTSIYSFAFIKLIGIILILYLIRKIMTIDMKYAIFSMRLILFLMLVVVGNNISVIVANAESGTILISNDQTYNYNTGSASIAGIPTVQTIFLWNSTWNYISAFHVTLQDTVFPLSYDSTRFSIVNGATGSGGWVSYDQSLSRIYYVFDTDFVITNAGSAVAWNNYQSINISMDRNIFTGTSWGNYVSTYTNLASNRPLCVMDYKDGSDHCMQGNYEEVHVSARGYDQYVVDYPLSGYFRVNVTKNSFLNSLYYINMTNGSIYSSESTYNKNNISNALFQYRTGIVLNATLSNGVFTNTIINMTTLAGSTTGTIEFNQSVYKFGNNSNITVTLNNPDFTSFSYAYELYNPLNTLIETINLGSTDTYPFNWTTLQLFNVAGNWRVNLISCPYGNCATKNILASDTAFVFGSGTSTISNLSSGSGNVYYLRANMTLLYPLIYNNSDEQVTYILDYTINQSVKDQNIIKWYIKYKSPDNVVFDANTQINPVCSVIDNRSTLRIISDFIFYGGDPLETKFSCYQKSQFFIEPPLENFSNGTYTVSLYEEVAYQPYLLDQKTFNVRNETGFQGIISISGNEIIPGTGAATNWNNSQGYISKNDNIGATCSYWDGLVGALGNGVNDAQRFQFALICIVLLMVLGFAITRDFGLGVFLGLMPYLWFLYLSVSTPCGQYMPWGSAVFISLVIGLKLKWF